MIAMIPIMLDLSGRKVTIFGGGNVAARKAAYFHAEADVCVVSRSFSPAFEGLSVRRIQCDLGELDGRALASIIAGSFLVIGATSDASHNARIGGFCRENAILFNDATGGACDVLLPSIIGGKNYCMGITTYGMSPAVPRFLRRHIEAEFPGLDAMIGLQADLRDELKESELSQEKRTAALRAVLDDPDIWELVGRDGREARRLAGERYIHE
jgi:precorrin-2 dehydrogenase/sirohydrochlorin ferrochelatase